MKTSTPLETCMTLLKKDNLKLKIPLLKNAYIDPKSVTLQYLHAICFWKDRNKFQNGVRLTEVPLDSNITGYICYTDGILYRLAADSTCTKAICNAYGYVYKFFLGILGLFQLEGQNQDLQICHHPQFQYTSNAIK